MAEHARLNKLRAFMASEGIDIGLIFEPDNQYYIGGFKAISYTRPIVTVVTKDTIELIVPGLEDLHAHEVGEKTGIDKIYVYHEVPELAAGGISERFYLEPMIAKFGKKATVGVEKSVMSASYFEYLLGLGYNIKDIGDCIFRMRYAKDSQEVAYLKIAAHLSDIALGASIKAARVGMSEMEFDVAGDRALLEYASKEYPDTEIGFANWTCSGVDRTALPHIDSNTRSFIPNDIIIHSRQVWFNQYRAENERTFILGEPTERQKEVFKITVEAQQAALDTIRPGIHAKEVDAAARAVIAKYGLAEYANHRVGHGLGLSEHEEPYLRFDNELILEEGMTYSVEPGIYIPGVGGFRHSDTAIVTKTGADWITTYPRDVESLIIPI